ncbi:phospholipase A1-like isoform X1 [Euwallacea fornicatus]|uniref:phospholipase A1-like isoform X1 n=1 Tax=Euwallacea fornicatus TaxID=995702 RepID=UPI00338FBE77
MSIVSLLIGTGINLLYIPFADYRSGNFISGSGGLFSPLSFLRNTSVCSIVPFTFGENEIKITAIPRGYCTNCCPIKISRDINFVLYNKFDAKKGISISPFKEKGAARKAGVNPNWKTVIFIHGFSEISPGESGSTIANAYLSRSENYNIILLDWGNLASFPWYRTATQNVKLVGKALGNFIKLFDQTGEIPVSNLHIVGFSLGCHIASVAGKVLPSNIKIPRIVGLDPAFPEFSVNDRLKRLAYTDALYVDIIHTDGGVFGIRDPVGHADFYPNGGTALQPGCQPVYLARNQLADQVLACSHIRAWRLYAESVRNPEAFPATRCENWSDPSNCNFTTDAYMGFGNRNSTGQFYLRTNFETPYGLNAEQQK